MWTKVFIFGTLLVVYTTAAQTFTRPKPCPVGTTYPKDCNTCTCAADGKDKCSQIDCSRRTAPTPTPAPSKGGRPGDCPTIVTPAPGSTTCRDRDEKSTCTEDKTCPQAKKCCANGCGVMSCRNAIYRYTK